MSDGAIDKFTTEPLPQKFSALGTTGWMIALIAGVPLLLTALFYIPLSLMGYESEVAWSFIGKIEVSFIISALTLLISYPIIKAAALSSNEPGIPTEFLAVKPLAVGTTLAVAIVTLLLSISERFVIQQLNIPISSSTLEFLANIESIRHLALAVIMLCVLAPIVEESIFRGVLYRRVEQGPWGAMGAVLITTAVFTLVHLQHSLAMMAVLLPGNLLLGLIRYKTDNLSYCILAHGLMNGCFLWFALS